MARGELRHDDGLEVDEAQSKIVVVRSAVTLDLQMSATPDPVVPGSRLLNQIVVTNRTSSALTGVQVLMSVPTGLSFNWSTNAQPNVSIGCSNCVPGDEAVWSLGTLAAGAGATIQVNTLVASGLANGTVITVPVAIISAGGSPEAVQAERTVVVN